MRNVADESWRENTRFVFINFFDNSAFYEKMWKNFVQRGRPQVTIWFMRMSCWMLRATNTYTQVV